MAKKHTRFVTFHYIVPVFIVFLILSLAGNGYGFYRIWQGNRVTAVPDGDSIDLADGRRIRLLALDAPERGRCMADDAKAGLTALVLGRHVRLKNTVKDSFGRTLAIVIIEEPRAWLDYLRWKLKTTSTGVKYPVFQEHLLRILI